VGSARAAAPAVAAYAGIRLFSVAVLWAWARARGPVPGPDGRAIPDDLVYLLGWRYDAGWYTQIAARGYDRAIPLLPDGTPRTSNLEFFPLFPGLIRLLTEVSPLTPQQAGLAISWTAGLIAAWGIYLVGAHLFDRRTGILLAVLWGALPHAIVQNMAYTETLFTAFAAFVIYALLRRRWLTAGALCFVAGLTRPTAVALIAALAVAALIAVWRRRDGWRPWVAVAIAPLGYVGFIAWVGLRLGRWDGYFRVLEIWGTPFDGGRYTAKTLLQVFTERDTTLVQYLAALVLVLSLVLLIVARRQPLPLLVYSGALLFLTVTAGGYMYSKGRLMMPAFALLLPLAAGMARLHRRTLAATLALVVGASAWYGGYLMLVWTASP
jgi:hypothetical protein